MLILAVTAAVLLLLLGNTARNAGQWQPLRITPDAALARLEPGWRLMLPPGPGPHRAAILLSGCDGVHDNMNYWARVMLDHGRAALILDSHGPRGLDRAQSWRAVCAAQVLTGAERAADIAVALQALASDPRLDATDVALLGASHGGWTAMEFLDLAAAGMAPPPGLTDWPAAPAALLARIGPVILLYPYCGVMSGADDARWPPGRAALMILAERDRITDPLACQAMADRLNQGGAGIAVQVIAGADHGFDQRERSALSPLEFVQVHTDAATAAVGQLLDAR
ncbi:dienelactone hydrolase [uncultured Paracoccus sp.]|uniref:dienelactone hydrolase family protein n=1 Tax=uncultured Paracoccus sp. TaxID=189685 RepID=UPI0025D112A6|nr:dienelactone hydrolase [uncultured Paracoccus sp.]